MAAADVQQPAPNQEPSVPDYLSSPNAVLGDRSSRWRYGKAPDYSKTRQVWEESELLYGLSSVRCSYQPSQTDESRCWKPPPVGREPR